LTHLHIGYTKSSFWAVPYIMLI